jgi:cysteine synthase
LEIIIIIFFLVRLTEKEKDQGVIAASAGNHGLALAYHGKKLGEYLIQSLDPHLIHFL